MFDCFIGTKKANEVIPLDPDILSPEGIELERGLLKKVIGQNRAVKQLVRTVQTFRSGLSAPGKPLGVLLFLGPTGSGKTRLVEALAECLFNSKKAMLKIDCAEFQHDHEVAKLIGSPPGYLGHDKTAPRLSQKELDKFQTPACKMSILLFDEIEKASDDLFQMMLGILDKAAITLGTNDSVDFSNTLIIMTSNLGSNAIQQIMGGNQMGFTSEEVASSEEMEDEVWKSAKEALRKKFSAEFINRIGRSIVFKPLSDETLKIITDLKLDGIQDRILLAGYFILLQVTEAAKAFICKEGTDKIYGARELNRKIETLLVEPAANLLSTKQVQTSDMLVVDYLHGRQLSFTKVEGVVDPPPPPPTVEVAAG